MNKRSRGRIIADYRRSLELQPDYRFGALQLYDLYFEDKDLPAARGVLENINKALPNDGYVLSRFVSLQLALKDTSAA